MSYVEMSFLGAFVALVGVAALTGFTRGFKRSTYKLALVIVAALVTVAVLPMVLDQIMSVNIQSVSGKEIELLGVKLTSLDQWIGGVASKYADQFLGSGATESLAGSIALISGILKMLISVLIFELLFIIINLLFTLLFHITKGFVDNKFTSGKRFKNKKVLGAVAGLVNGVVVAFITLSPLLGVADMLKPYAADENLRGLIPEQYIEYVDDYVGYDGFVKKLFGIRGIDVALFNRITTVEVDGQKISADDVKAFSSVIGDVMWLANNAEAFKDIQNADAETLEQLAVHVKNLVDFVFDSGFTGIIVNDAVRYLNTAEFKDLVGDNATLAPILDAALKGLFGDKVGEALEPADVTAAKQALKDVVFFGVDLIASGVLGDLLDITKEGANIADSLGKVFDNEKFIDALATYLNKPLISALMGAALDIIPSDGSMGMVKLPIADFFGFFAGATSAEIKAEFGNFNNMIKTLLDPDGAFGKILAGEDPDFIALLGGLLDAMDALVYGTDGNVSLVGRTFLAIAVNALGEQLPLEDGETRPAFIGTSHLDQDEWNAEAALFSDILQKVAIAAAQGSEITPDTFIGVGKAFDNLKDSTLFAESYNMFIDAILDEMQVKSQIAGLADTSDYRDIKWEDTFSMVMALQAISTNTDWQNNLSDSLNALGGALQGSGTIEDSIDALFADAEGQQLLGALKTILPEDLSGNAVFDGVFAAIESQTSIPTAALKQWADALFARIDAFTLPA